MRGGAAGRAAAAGGGFAPPAPAGGVVVCVVVLPALGFFSFSLLGRENEKNPSAAARAPAPLR